MNPKSIEPSEPFPRVPVPPELLAWAQQTFDAQEYLEGVKEIEAGHGRTFDSLIAEVEARVRGS
jgi:hypothetical protein